jgi:FkbH-like protein
MYESEVNLKIESSSVVPENVLTKFLEYKTEYSHRSTILWGEHCTECNFPSCYSTCELYSPRIDSKCRLFIDGSVLIDYKKGVNPYLLKISFKRWGKLWTKSITRGKINLYTGKSALTLEKLNIKIGRFLQNIPLEKFRIFLIKKFGSVKKHSQRIRSFNNVHPTHFIVECYNPQDQIIKASLTLRPNEVQKEKKSSNSCSVTPFFFQKLINLNPGYNLEKIPFKEIRSLIDFSNGFEIEFTPNNINDGTTLIFGLIDFVAEKKEIKKSKKLKCLVWDLDNTLWKGILVEDGADKINLNKNVKEIIMELDNRGIILSIASKNNEPDVLEVLKNFGIIDYFLFPQISWNPKSQSIANIAKRLNIGLDSIAFIDDQPFERAEIGSSLPEVTVIDAKNYLNLLEFPEFNVPVTEESKKRRSMYKEQIKRDEYLESSGGDYIKFLKECDIKIYLRSMNEKNIDRVYELAQRTNQMNFSGRRYQKAELNTLMNSNDFHSYVISCEDKFGSYGIVGFSLLDHNEPRLIDLMFSCRVQSKRVEHAFLSHLLKKYILLTNKDFYANYTKTEKNKPSGKVFYDIGFEENSEKDGVTSLRFRSDKEILDDNLIAIFDESKNL